MDHHHHLLRRGSFDEGGSSPGRTSNQSFLNLHSCMQFSHLKKVTIMMQRMMMMVMKLGMRAIITFSLATFSCICSSFLLQFPPQQFSTIGWSRKATVLNNWRLNHCLEEENGQDFYSRIHRMLCDHQ